MGTPITMKEVRDQTRKRINSQHFFYYSSFSIIHQGTAVAQWLRCCATNRKVAGSIPAGVLDFSLT